VAGFEGLVQPFECIASSLDVGSVAELTAVPFLPLSEEDGPEEAEQMCNDSTGVKKAATSGGQHGNY
jgi:hypothetical protein